MLTRREFMCKYQTYYLMLENRFIHTTQYVELDEHNYGTFSNEYALLIQAIGAELDSFFKEYCEFDPSDKRILLIML